jgi:hypothetical protein
LIDFVIPAHEKDFDSLPLVVEGIQKNISCSNRVFITSDIDPKIPNTIYVGREKETNYDHMVSLEKIEKIWNERNPVLAWRSGWIYQQIVKLLTARAIPELTDSFVIVDSDTIFVKDVSFDIDKFYYTSSPEKYHSPYLQPIMTLLNVDKTIGFTVTAHHGIYHKAKLEEMLSGIEERFGMPFTDALLSILDYGEVTNEGSAFNEQDLYANYMILKYPEMSVRRDLRWLNIPFIPDQEYLNKTKQEYDFVSCHAYLRS